MNKFAVHADPDLADLLPAYLERRQAELEQLREAARENDYEKLRAIAHQIKGSAPSYGFAKLGAVAVELEQAAKKQAADGVDAALAAIADYLQRVEVIYPQ